jgi:ABC-type multidrug transport system fused ATPase/permease subunit
MSVLTMIVGAFVLALIISTLVWGVGIIAIPVALVAIALVGFFDLNRRRKQARMIHDHREQAKTESVDFTERDQRTLVNE